MIVAARKSGMRLLRIRTMPEAELQMRDSKSDGKGMEGYGDTV